MKINPCEFKLARLRECPVPDDMKIGDTPDQIAAYYREAMVNHLYHNPDVETFYVVLLNTRRRIMGHVLVSNGTLDTLLVHAREVFRPAIVGAAAAVVLLHCHPSGDPTPSEADIKVTRDLIRAGQLLKIEVLDHVVMGQPSPSGNANGYVSLRALGYFAV